MSELHESPPFGRDWSGNTVRPWVSAIDQIGFQGAVSGPLSCCDSDCANLRPAAQNLQRIVANVRAHTEDDMKRPALSALVLQGGGALGAYELAVWYKSRVRRWL
jgi:hypothetical protein